MICVPPRSSCDWIWPRRLERLPITSFFQAEGGMRYVAVTGVQTCALPISCFRLRPDGALLPGAQVAAVDVPVLRLRVDDPGLHIVDRRIKAVAAVNHLPVFIHDAVARQRDRKSVV